MYAIDSYGDTALAKRALEFLLRRQRADGKMMHEFSQMADDLPSNIPWASFPYEYAAADATPLFLMALRDYVRTSGDTAFVAEHWAAAKRAWNFERAHDSDGDGVYDNSEGTGWVENWQSPMPHQELYLAALDAEASRAMADLAAMQHDSGLSKAAQQSAAHIQTVIESYRDTATGLYAFSKNLNGSMDRTLSVYPSVGLWGADGIAAAARPHARCLDRPRSGYGLGNTRHQHHYKLLRTRSAITWAPSGRCSPAGTPWHSTTRTGLPAHGSRCSKICGSPGQKIPARSPRCFPVRSTSRLADQAHTSSGPVR